MKKYIIIVCLLLAKSIFAQEPDEIRLSVQDCIDMALENNIELKNSQLESGQPALSCGNPVGYAAPVQNCFVGFASFVRK